MAERAAWLFVVVAALATPVAAATCVTLQVGVCCTDRNGTNCSSAVCAADANCTVAPFLACGGASQDDGLINRFNSTVYPPNTAIVVDDAFFRTAQQRSFYVGPPATFNVQNGAMRFNTAAVLPGDAMVSSATLTVQVVEPPVSVDGLSLTGEWYDWGLTVGPEDYSEVPFSSAFSVSVSSIAVGRTTIPLSDAATNVSLTGYTYLRTHMSQRPGDAAPTGVNMVRIALFDNTSVAGPALTVCYTGSGPLPTPKATPTGTSTPAVTSTPTSTLPDVEDDRYLPPNTWVRLTTVPTQRFIPMDFTDCTRMGVLSHPVGRRASSIVYGDGIFYFGGGGQSHPGNDVELFDIASNTWNQQYQPECLPSCCYAGRCFDGVDEGRICSSDPDCPGSHCEAGHCNTGPDSGNLCMDNSACVNRSCSAYTCSGGSRAGAVCASQADCPGGTCSGCHAACDITFTGTSELTPSGRPYVEHAVQLITYNSLRKRYTYAHTSGLWEWDPSTTEWNRLSPDRPESTDVATKMLVYDPDLETVLYFATTQANHTVFRFDYTTNTWVVHGPIPDQITWADIFSAYDSKEHKYLVSHGTRTMWIYDALARTWTRLQNVPADVLLSYSLAYDAVAGVFVLGRPDMTNSVRLWSYRIATDTWTKLEPAAGPPNGPTGDSNLLVYDQVWKRFYFLNTRSAGPGGGEGGSAEKDVETWSYRIGGPVGPGDANCDGVVTAADLPGLVQSLASNPTDGCGAVDTNRDGVVSEADLSNTIDMFFEVPH